MSSPFPVEPGVWDALVPAGRGPLRHAFLDACGHVELARFGYHPFFVRGPEGAVVAQAPAYAYDLNLGLFASGAAPRGLWSFWPAVARFLRVRVLEIGCPAALAEPFCIRAGIDEERSVEALARLAIATGTQGHIGLIVVRDIEPGRVAVWRALTRMGFAPVPMPPTHVLRIRHQTFDQYLRAMRARYRRRALEVFGCSTTLHPELLTEFDGLAPQLARLWRDVYDRAHEVRREVLPAAFFRALAAVPGAGVLLLRRPDGSIVSFGLLLEDRPWLRFLYTGFEEAHRAEGAYFRLMYEIVRLAIDRRFEWIEFGITSAEPKLATGATAKPLEAWIRHHRRPVHHLLVRLLRTVLAPRHIVSTPRRVFHDDGTRSVEFAGTPEKETWEI